MNTKLYRLVHLARTRGTKIKTLGEVADDAGISRYHLWRLLHGECVPSALTRAALAKGLGFARGAVDACWPAKGGAR